MKTLTKAQLAVGGVDTESLALSLASKAVDAAIDGAWSNERDRIVARLLRALGDRFGFDVVVTKR